MSTNSLRQMASMNHKVLQHSPYSTPVLYASDMYPQNRDYYGCTSSSSDDELHAEGSAGAVAFGSHQLPPSQQFAQKVPPPPSYVQVTSRRNSGSIRGSIIVNGAQSDSESNAESVNFPTTPHHQSHQSAGFVSVNGSGYHSDNSSPSQRGVMAPPPAVFQSSRAGSPSGSPPMVDQRHHHQQQQPAMPETVYHGKLMGHLEFIQPPQVPQQEYPTPAYPCYRLFLGQIRFETTASEVRWILQYIAEVRALKVESRGIGCFLAYFKSYDEMVKVQQLHKRILFDHSGIWYARSQSQADFLAKYVAENLSNIGRGFRLPKDMMVVEEEKVGRSLNIPSCPPPQYHSFPQQQYPPPPRYDANAGMNP